MIKVWGREIRSENLKLSNSILNREWVYVEWRESIIVAIYNKSDKRDCSNYREIQVRQPHTKWLYIDYQLDAPIIIYS